MIAYLEGRVFTQTLNGDACILLTKSGVGYLVHLSASASRVLPARGELAAFHIATLVREDAIDLYGFPAADERETFLVCLTIANLGPKIALALLATYSPDALRQVVATGDPVLLTRVPGIGKKKAQQIFLELKYKLKIPECAASLPEVASSWEARSFYEALAGLINLGYDEHEARSVLEEVFTATPELGVASALRRALKTIAKGC